MSDTWGNITLSDMTKLVAEKAKAAETAKSSLSIESADDGVLPSSGLKRAAPLNQEDLPVRRSRTSPPGSSFTPVQPPIGDGQPEPPASAGLGEQASSSAS